MKRREPQLTKKFRKDPKVESFLSKFNDILAPYQEEDYIENLPETYPTLHVVGAPRSGTTLLVQLLASQTDLGYINNLIAAFWKAPVYGIKLSQLVVPTKIKSSFHSEFGRTSGIHEPHEFGYFWSSLLNYKDMLEQSLAHEETIDWLNLRKILLNLSHAFEKPVLFKSFLLGWHINTVQKIMPKTCWLHIRRDPIQNAISILGLRETFLGSRKLWASLKPKEYCWLKEQPYWEQVAGQVYFIEKSLRTQLKNVASENVVSITYDELCSSPFDVLKKVQKTLAKLGTNINIDTLPANFSFHKSELLDSPDRQPITTAWNKLCSEFGSLEVQ